VNNCFTACRCFWSGCQHSLAHLWLGRLSPLFHSALQQLGEPKEDRRVKHVAKKVESRTDEEISDHDNHDVPVIHDVGQRDDADDEYEQHEHQNRAVAYPRETKP